MSKNQKCWIPFTLAIPPSVVIILHGYLGSFTRMIADDYCNSYLLNRLGALRTSWYWYLNFAGVYSRSLIHKFLQVAAPDHMDLIVPVVLIIWLAITVLTVSLLKDGDTSRRKNILGSIFLSIAFIFLVLLMSPQLTQSLYWWSGFSAYTAPLVLATFYFAAFLIFLKASKMGMNRKTIVGWSILSFLAGFGLGGISESFSPTLLLFIAFIISWRMLTEQLNHHQPSFWFLIAGLTGTLFALITMISAPGNAVRQSYFPAPPPVMDIFQIAIIGYLDFLKSIIVTPQKLAGVFGAALGAMVLGMQETDFNKLLKKSTGPAILILSIFFAFLCFPPAVFGTSEPPPNRVMVISSFIIAAGLIASGYLGGKSISLQVRDGNKRVLIKSLALVALFLLSHSAWITSKDLYDSRMIFLNFAVKWDEAHAQILQAKADGAESVMIPALDNWAGLERPTANKRNWVNICISKYYGIQVYAPPYNEP